MKIVDLRELALKKVKITGNVIGKFGSFEITQVYKNNTNDILEVGYTFPIVETATVVGFEINVGDKVLKGVCKEKGEAKKEYQNNIVKGNSAYLMEQETDNIFKISVGKIDKDEEVTVKIQYIDKFEIIDNTIHILIPTLVTSKYRSNITDKLVYGKVDYTIDFNINIDKTLNRKSLNCPSHTINVIDEEKNERVEVLDYDLSRDFKLDIELKNELSSNAIVSKTRDEKDLIYLSFMPEIVDTYEDSEKEYVFIIDVSGSMMGEKINETKRAVIECLKQLDEGDKFNIVLFESEFEAMNINAIEFNEENLQKAITFVNNLKPLGGTRILNPIKFALYERNVEKVILLFTDGQVGNEEEIINYVSENINRSRMFTFGIDTNVNSSFIKQLAKAGNGKAELIMPKEKIGDKIIRTFARIQTPFIENLIIDYGKNKVLDEIKEENNLFNYEFFNVFAIIENLEDDIQLKGKILDKEYIWKISKDEIRKTDVDLEVLFAKQQMERLEDYMRDTLDRQKKDNYRQMIIDLAVKYNINSKYTSFITVYEREKKLFDVSKYQETILSNKFFKDAIVDSLFTESEVVPDFSVQRKVRSAKPTMDASCSRDLGMPEFFGNNPNLAQEYKKTDEVILKEKIDEYYKEFILKEEKSILTYLLYAIYYSKKYNSNFNYSEFLEFLNKNKESILASDEYMKLLYLWYYKLNNYKKEKEQALELLKDEYKKMAVTNLKISIDLKKLSAEEIRDIIDNNKIADRINDILEHFC